MSKKVSIIIPIYNSEEHIEICLNSILNQTYRNIEIVLVNDGSTDNSLRIIRKYGKKYGDKIKIIDQKNGGVSSARNVGLENATGYYIMFSDNDDYMEKNYIETYVDESSDNDIIIGGYIRKTYDGKTLFTRKLVNKVLCPYIQLASWGKLYKSTFIKKNNLHFLKTAIADDFYFNIFAYNLTNKIKVINNTGYYWMYNSNSLSNTDSKKLNRVDDLLLTLSTIKKNLSPKDKEITNYFYIRTIVYYILFSSRKVEYKKVIKEYNKMFNWLKENNVSTNNKYIKIFNNSGEQTSVKLIIWTFMLVRKIKLMNLFLFFYCKV